MTKKILRSTKGRKKSSTLWLKRQLKDPYVDRAQKEGYRSRAAYKLLEINEKTDLLKPGLSVIDLGAAPGGWCQVAAEAGCKVVGLDLLAMDPLPDVAFFQLDFMDDKAPELLIEAVGGGADIVLSDMAPNTTGHKKTDHLKIMALVEAAYDFALEVLKEEGTFIAKVRQGGTENDLLARMKQDFKTVKHIKPPSSRKESSETYVIATGFRALPP
ncbi:MAG: RlmE family RNA methyltransferase [Rhodospirillales bacterium]|nr:RlmE family RNA methyltransferase [Alphaproteobacteria bacterium]USO04055.1 MAG: RlmE family RNA methyltransferase [Rhodospirillales bacterium]